MRLCSAWLAPQAEEHRGYSQQAEQHRLSICGLQKAVRPHLICCSDRQLPVDAHAGESEECFDASPNAERSDERQLHDFEA